MSIPTYINNIKHSGIFRFVFDKSEVAETPVVDALRLVVGYSDKGPFNTPVLIRNESEFKKVFGGISKKLERYGCYFHRLALQCLKTGDAILALNIKPFTSEFVEGVNFNVQEYIENKINIALNELYNTDRFWKLEPEHLENIESLQNESLQDKYITITTTDSKESNSNTIFVRGYLPKGYNITFKEYYSTMGLEMPTYVEGYEMEKLQNYFAEIYVFNGEFTPEIASSELLSKYFIVEGTSVKLRPYLFNAFGEKIDTLAALANNEASNFIRAYSGILLPDFQSTTGSIISLDSIFNADYALHKCLMRLNQTMLFDNDEFTLPMISTTGWTADPNKGMMSLTKIERTECVAKYENGAWTYDDSEDSIFYTYDDANIVVEGNQVVLPDYFNQVSFKLGDSFLGNSNNVVTLTNIEESGDNIKCKFSGELLKKTFIKKSYVVYDKDSFERLLPKSYLSEHAWNANGTDTQSTLPWLCIEFEKTKAKDLTFKVGGVAEKTINYNTETEVSLLTLDKAELGVQDMVGDWTIHINAEPEYAKLEIETDGQVYAGTGKVICTAANTQVLLKKCVNSATVTSANLAPIYLKGYTYLNTKPESNKQMAKLKWQKQILNVLTEKGIRTALTNNVDISYKYLVDTFESFVETECKSILASICKEKFNCLGFLNVPSMKTFSTCDYTSYKDSNGNFNIEYIAKGGNVQKGVVNPFTLVTDENGASFVNYVSCLVLKDVSTGVKTTIPGAALISNAYMKKYENRFPYSIVAGPNYGKVTDNGLIGPDFNFGYDDLNVLEPMGVNCFVYAPGKGTFINSQQTAKQNPVTALSKVHVRELCTFLQDEIEKMLQNYQWEFNNQRLRDEVRGKADVICDTCMRNGGINAYVNKCDASNNTNELIENEFFILETEIEPGFGAGKMIQKLTIRKNGTISAEISE
jgi:hypothetical protein